MDNDSRLTVNEQDITWGDLLEKTQEWEKKWWSHPRLLQQVLEPYVNFICKYRFGGISFKHRLEILFTGKLPDAL